MNFQQLAAMRGVPKRMGYYVENVFYDNRINQAKARAVFLSKQYGRPIDIVFVPWGDERLVKGDVVYNVFGDSIEPCLEHPNW